MDLSFIDNKIKSFKNKWVNETDFRKKEDERIKIGTEIYFCETMLKKAKQCDTKKFYRALRKMYTTLYEILD